MNAKDMSDAEWEARRKEYDARRLARLRELHGDDFDENEPRGEFMTVGPDGEVSDLQMHAEILQEDDLLEAAEAQRKRWAARRKEIAREEAAKRNAARAHGALAAHRRNR